MAGPDLTTTLSFVTQALLLLTTVLATRAWLKRRDRELRDIALMFASFGISTIVTWIGQWPLYYRASWLTILSGIAVVAHPYLIVRVVRQFKRVPPWVEWPLLAGMVGSWGYIVWNTLANTPGAPATSGPAVAALLGVLAYFVYGELYAAFVFVSGSRRSAGVARRRLSFAAAGTALLGFVFLVATVNVLAPEYRTGVTFVTQPLIVLAILAWYAAFAPPKWLRRAWRLDEVQKFLSHTSGRSADERAARSVHALRLAALQLTGASRASLLVPEDDSWAVSVLKADGTSATLRFPRLEDTPLARAFAASEVIVDHHEPAEAAAARAQGAPLEPVEHAVFLPLPGPAGPRGILVVSLERIPLFLDESIEALRMLAEQTAVALDVQAFAKEQEELRLREAHLASEELRRQNLAMQEATRLKSEFLANMSHELRTPLNGIIGFADLMASGKVGPVSAQHEEYLGDILTSARHLLRLINDVLDLAKIEAGRMEFRPEPFDARDLLGEALAGVRPLAHSKSIEIKLDLDPGAAPVHLDPVRFKQVAYNYVSNAIKFTPDHGLVTVRLRPEGEAVRLEVEDTGVGIKADDIPKLFREFSQLDEGMAKQHQGTGLGLALVRRLAEAQGGSVGVRSVPGKGSTFHIVLPRTARAPVQQTPPADAIRVGPHVLVVDDDESDRRSIATTLRSEGYQVHEAATGRDALALIERHAFDAATIDLVLPDLHGYDLIKALRERANGASVAILIVTQLPTSTLRVAFPVEGVYQKPVEPQVIAAALQRAGILPSNDRPVLVVDDDPTVRRLLETHLRAMGYRATTASDGIEALASAKDDPPALIVLDLVMPRMDGFGFLEAYRRAGGTAPILVWTSKDLTTEEAARLQGQTQLIAYKADGGSLTLAHRLQEALGRR